VVKQWRNVATQLGLGNKELTRMESAFEHIELEKALNL